MNCDKTAVALLTFAPPEAKAWLYDLEKPDPTGGIMLCRSHANSTVVPMSWQLIDARDPAWPGPVGSQPVVQAMSAASAEEFLPSRSSAPAAMAAEHMFSRQAVPATTGDATRSPEPLLDDVVPAQARSLPSDAAAIDEEFAALRADLPVTPHPYAEPAFVPAAAPAGTNEVLIDATEAPDPSLFELPFTDAPAVTPHPGY